MNRREQAIRDDKLGRARARGFSESTLANAFNVDARTVRRAYRKYREERRVWDEADPLHLIDDEWVRLEWALNDLGEIRRGAKSPWQTIAAISTQLRVLRQQRDLAFQIGILEPIGEGYEALRGDVVVQLFQWIRAEVSKRKLGDEVTQFVHGLFTEWLEAGSNRAFARDWGQV